jgi:hypothetical protein
MWKRLGMAAAVAAPAWAQCSMCRTAAAAQGAGGVGALNAAIVVLFVPAVVLFCGVFAFALRGDREDRGERG